VRFRGAIGVESEDCLEGYLLLSSRGDPDRDAGLRAQSRRIPSDLQVIERQSVTKVSVGYSLMEILAWHRRSENGKSVGLGRRERASFDTTLTAEGYCTACQTHLML
jgi:hypothetical protein